MNIGTLKVYPAMEMLAIDMAEALRAAYTFDGIIQGCGIYIENDELRMSPGRIMMGGRLGVFDADSGKTYMTINLPTGHTSQAKRHICVVCDLRATGSANPFYLELLTELQLRDIRAVCASFSDENFNAGRGVRVLDLGYVEVTTGPNPRPVNLSVNPSKYPDNVVKTNKNYTDAVSTRELKHWDTLSAWTNYFKTVRHKIGFYRNYTVTADNLTIQGNSLGSFKLSKEINGVVIVKPSSGTPAIPATAPYAYINPSGGAVISSSKGKLPDNPNPNVDERGIPIGLYNVYANRGIVGIQISNATTGGSNASSCVIQSYYIDPSEESKGLMTVAVRNLGSAPAKIKLSVTSLFVRDVDYPKVNPTT